MKINSLHRRMKIIPVIGIILLFSVGCRKDELPKVTDIDGNQYHYVAIGSQEWMVENLKVTRYRNGDSIQEVSGNSAGKAAWGNLTSGAYCNYNDDSNDGRIYGLLYNWYVVNDSRNVAPSGWHVATVDDWNTLINYLSGTDVAGGKLKETGIAHWISPNSDASNTVKFSALPSGLRDYHGNFTLLGEVTEWWIPKEYDTNFALFTQIGNGASIQITGVGQKSVGCSIRCVRD